MNAKLFQVTTKTVLCGLPREYIDYYRTDSMEAALANARADWRIYGPSGPTNADATFTAIECDPETLKPV